jgi:hypothetical protein
MWGIEKKLTRSLVLKYHRGSEQRHSPQHTVALPRRCATYVQVHRGLLHLTSGVVSSAHRSSLFPAGGRRNNNLFINLLPLASIHATTTSTYGSRNKGATVTRTTKQTCPSPSPRDPGAKRIVATSQQRVLGKHGFRNVNTALGNIGEVVLWCLGGIGGSVRKFACCGVWRAFVALSLLVLCCACVDLLINRSHVSYMHAHIRTIFLQRTHESNSRFALLLAHLTSRRHSCASTI